MPEELTWAQFITSVIAGIAVLISWISLARTGNLQRQQMQLHTKQAELIDLQLEALRKQALEPTPSAQEKADVRATLESFGDTHRFVITNWGRVPARDVVFLLDPVEGRSTPLVEGDYDEKIPINELAPGGQVPVWAALAFGTGTVFPATWRWRNPDGSTEERQSLLAI